LIAPAPSSAVLLDAAAAAAAFAGRVQMARRQCDADSNPVLSNHHSASHMASQLLIKSSRSANGKFPSGSAVIGLPVISAKAMIGVQITALHCSADSNSAGSRFHHCDSQASKHVDGIIQLSKP
jgi:hypothetical protein